MLFSTALLALLPAVLAAPAPLIQPRDPSAKLIPGKYIVKFKDDSSDVLISKALGDRKPDYLYKSKGFKGFAGALDTASLDKIRGLPEVSLLSPSPLVVDY